MTRSRQIVALATCLTLAGLVARGARPARRQALPDVLAPAPRLHTGIRKPARHDAPIAESAPVTTWSLVQLAPTFQVLATGDCYDRLEAEQDVLVEMHIETYGRDKGPFHSWMIRPAEHLTSARA